MQYPGPIPCGIFLIVTKTLAAAVASSHRLSPSSVSTLDLIRRHEGISRAEVARRVGVTPQAVSKTVAELVERGLVREIGSRPNGVGRAPVRLSLVPEGRFAFGVELDRAGALITLVDLGGRVVDQLEVATAPQSPPEYVALLGGKIQTIIERNPKVAGRIEGCGVGMVGPVDHYTGVATAPNNFGDWKDVPLARMLADRVGLPVILDKNTNMALMARHWLSPEQGWMAAIFIGTGIGGALMLDGEVYRGPHSDAMEIGHTIVDPDGPKCVCGRHGCVEVYTSPAAIVSNYTEAATGERLIPYWREDTPRRLADIVQAADQGDTLAVEALSRGGRLLAIASANVVKLLDIETVVLTGTLLAQLGRHYIDGFLSQAVWDNLTTPRTARVAIVDETRPDLIALGAAFAVLEGIDA
jgi:predicted NBD/HSP70 family sugar kinase